MNESNPIKSAEELIRLKRLRKDTEDSIKDKGKKLQYKQLSLKLRNKLKEENNHCESAPLLEVDNQDESKIAGKENKESKTLWYAGDTGKWSGAPALPDLQLRNEDFKKIGSGSLSKDNSINEPLTQERYNSTPEPFPQKLLQSYCRLTDESPHFTKHRKALIRKQEIMNNYVPPKRIRRSSEPSYSNSSVISGDDILEESVIMDTNFIQQTELGRVNDKLRRVVEGSSNTNKLGRLRTSLRKEYHAEMSRQFCAVRFSSENKDGLSANYLVQRDMFSKDKMSDENSFFHSLANQMNDLDSLSVCDVSFDNLPSALTAPVQRMIEAPKRERRHSFSDKSNTLNNEQDTYLDMAHSTTNMSEGNKQFCATTKICRESQLKAQKNPSISYEIPAKNSKKESKAKEYSKEEDVVFLDTVSSDAASTFFSKTKQIEAKIQRKKIPNLADDIVDLLHDGDDAGYKKTDEEMALLDELRMKEAEKQCIEMRQREIVKKLKELKNKEYI